MRGSIGSVILEIIIAKETKYGILLSNHKCWFDNVGYYKCLINRSLWKYTILTGFDRFGIWK